MSVDPRPAPPRRCPNCGAPVFISGGKLIGNGGTEHVCPEEKS